jgi:hypothetical protein
MLRRSSPRLPERLALAALVLLAACGGDGGLAPIVPVTKSITVDASAGYVYLKLDTTANVVAVATPSTSEAWDMGFFATGVTLNGGAAGPGGVSAYCLCANSGATTAQLQAMTAANQLGAFDSVEAGVIPAAASFQADALDPVINGWFSGSGAAAIPVTTRAFILRKTVSAAVILSKFQVTAISGATASAPGQVSFQYAVQPSAGAAFGATQSKVVNVAAGSPVYFDLTAGAATTAGGTWDIAFDGWTIRVNGGVSGAGGVSAVPDNATAFANITATYAASAPPQAYRSDSFSGVFAASPWYRYNITGSDNQIWPTFNVYLVRRGSAVYKVQLTSYYSPSGAPRNITIRYAQLAN